MHYDFLIKTAMIDISLLYFKVCWSTGKHWFVCGFRFLANPHYSLVMISMGFFLITLGAHYFIGVFFLLIPGVFPFLRVLLGCFFCDPRPVAHWFVCAFKVFGWPPGTHWFVCVLKVFGRPPWYSLVPLTPRHGAYRRLVRGPNCSSQTRKIGGKIFVLMYGV